MTTSLTNAKKNKMKNLCVNTLSNSTPTIYQIASLLGNIAASFEAGTHGRLHYQYLEQNIIVALREARESFESPCIITSEASRDIIWWRNNILDVIASLYPTPEVDLRIFTDVSNEGLSASTNDQTINGRWNKSEKFLHINKLELLLSNMHFFHFCNYILTSNMLGLWLTIALLCPTSINKVAHSSMCNKLTIEIWEICKKHLSHLFVAHIPGKHNFIADLASRIFQDSAKWMISTNIFDKPNLIKSFVHGHFVHFMICGMQWLLDYFQIRVPSVFVNINTFLRSPCRMSNLFFNVYWFLRILNSALFPRANTQRPDVIVYLPFDYTTSRIYLCTGLAVYNQVKKLATGEIVSALGQKKICNSQKG